MPKNPFTGFQVVDRRYARVFFVAFGDWDQEKAEALIAKRGDRFDSNFVARPDAYDGWQVVTHENRQFIWCKQAPLSAKNVSTLAHELLHVMLDEARILGYGVSEDSEEFLAYGIGYLMQEILRKVWMSKRFAKHRKWAKKSES